jgi:hypothetical protein
MGASRTARCCRAVPPRTWDRTLVCTTTRPCSSAPTPSQGHLVHRAQLHGHVRHPVIGRRCYDVQRQHRMPQVGYHTRVTSKAVGSLVDYDVGGSGATYCFPANYTTNARFAPCRDGETTWVLWEVYRSNPQPAQRKSLPSVPTTTPQSSVASWRQCEYPSPQLAHGRIVLVVSQSTFSTTRHLHPGHLPLRARGRRLLCAS